MANNITGTPRTSRFSETYLEERCRKVQTRYVTKKPDGCWEGRTWQNRDGYCMISVNGRDIPLHKFMYEVIKEVVPTGLVLDHKCRNRQCCNPDHLEAVTQQENIRRSPVFKHGRYAKQGALNG